MCSFEGDLNDLMRKKDYSLNSIVQVSTYEDNRWFCALKIKDVQAIKRELTAA